MAPEAEAKGILERIEEKLDELLARPVGTATDEPAADDDDLTGEAPAETKKVTTLEQVQDAVREAVGRNKEKTVAALAKFKVKRASELKPEQYDEAITALGKVK